MVYAPPSAYVPPHLRPKTSPRPAHVPEKASSALNGAKPDVKKDVAAVAKPKAQQICPPSPPSTPNEPQKSDLEKTFTKDISVIMEKHKPKPKPQSTFTNNGRQPRGPWKKFAWPKNRDMKPQPYETEHDGGVDCRWSDSNGDPDYDIRKLVDWEGNWLPPPVDAADRTGFVDRHFGNRIERWINSHDDACYVPVDISSPSYTTKEDRPNGNKEIVPRHWTISMIEQKSLGEFWKCMLERAPDAVSDIDVTADPPYWERYEHPKSIFLNTLLVPEAKLDLSEDDNRSSKDDSPKGISIDQWLSQERAKQEKALREKRAKMAKRIRPVREVKSIHAPKPPSTHIVPRLEIYVRPIRLTDMDSVARIYNYYIEETIHMKEFEPFTGDEVGAKIKAAIDEGLPFLAAILKNARPTPDNEWETERIVGFAKLVPYWDIKSSYRYSYDLDLYVHPGYKDSRIGQCLLDKLLELCDPSYTARGGYEYKNDGDYLKVGKMSVIKSIYVTAHLESGEKDDLLEKGLKKFKFLRAGHFKMVGFKYGKTIDSFSYQYQTSETINAQERPCTAPQDL